MREPDFLTPPAEGGEFIISWIETTRFVNSNEKGDPSYGRGCLARNVANESGSVEEEEGKHQ